MKLEKWTIGLAAVGLVTLSPAVLAQDAAPKLVPVQTALSATTISGYVDTSAVWNPGTGNANPAPFAFNKGKQDGFNLDAVDVKFAKAADEEKWSAGYVIELNYGPDAGAIDGGAAPIRQAYIDLKTPIGNGIDWQLGRWDALLGFESSDAMKNPNWTHSYGKTFEPTEEDGLLGSYAVNSSVNIQAGVADTVTTGPLNARSDGSGSVIESKKAVVGLVTLTAPDSWGSFKGSTLAFGCDFGPGHTAAYVNDVSPVRAHDRTELYVGATINTPVKDLTLGATWDSIEHNDIATFIGAIDTGYFNSWAGYASYKVEKLTFSARAEYADGFGLGALTGGFPGIATPNFDKVFDLTGTVQYDLWANVISRLEVRWDHATDDTTPFGANNLAPTVTNGGTKRNDILVAANVIYKF